MRRRHVERELQVEVPAPDASEGSSSSLVSPTISLGYAMTKLSLPVPLTRTRSGQSPRSEKSRPSPRRKVIAKKPQPAKKQSFKSNKKPAPSAPRTASACVLSSLVPNESQEASWDCGLACVRMVLLAMGCPSADCTFARLRSRLASTEVWSIDLAYVLAEYGCVGCEYLTSSIEAHSPSRRRCPFYAATIGEDLARVTALMAHAEACDVHVRSVRLSAAELWNCMRDDDRLAIVLVDPRVLYSSVASDQELELERGSGRSGSTARAAEESGNRAFFGHYVLLVGLDDANDAFILKDPARGTETETRVSAARLEKARKAKGTDEDLLLIPLYEADREPTAPTVDESMIQKVLALSGAGPVVESPVLG